MSRSRTLQNAATAAPIQLSAFVSDLGWFGVVGRDNRVRALTFGHRTPGEVHEHLLADGVIARLTSPIDWCPELRERLQAYAMGSCDNFSDITLVAERSTPFQQRVVDALRNVRYGATLSYADLAALAGSPNAARAVGSVMATNPVPIIIPCHRVIGSGGRLGGYSAPSGLEMKQRLLELEGVEGFCLATT